MRRRNKEGGFALIVTLLVLVVVTIIGVSAMRLGFLSLTTSTNSQVNMLLMGAANGGLNAVTDQMATDATAALKTTGLLGEALFKPGFESIRCFTIADKLANNKCDPTATGNADAFSGRGSSYVQIAALTPTDAAGGAQSMVSYGTDDDSVPVAGGYKIVVVSTSAIPVLAGDDGTKAKACYTNISDDSLAPSTTSVTDCMTNESIPFTTVVQNYCIGYSC